MTAAQAMADALVSAERERRRSFYLGRAPPQFLGAGTAYEARQCPCSSGAGGRRRERVIGAKLGLTSKVKRAALGIHEPVSR